MKLNRTPKTISEIVAPISKVVSQLRYLSDSYRESIETITEEIDTLSAKREFVEREAGEAEILADKYEKLIR